MKHFKPALAIIVLMVVSLASIGAGITAAFGWQWAAIVIGALLWFDLYTLGRASRIRAADNHARE